MAFLSLLGVFLNFPLHFWPPRNSMGIFEKDFLFFIFFAKLHMV